jgi:hypothetical protein
MSTVVRADFYAYLAHSEPRVLRVTECADLAAASGPYDLVIVAAPCFTAQDEDEVAAAVRTARALLAPSGRLALDYPNPRLGQSALPPAERLDHLLTEAGLVVHERYGDFARSPFTSSSPELVTIAGIEDGASE